MEAGFFRSGTADLGKRIAAGARTLAAGVRANPCVRRHGMGSWNDSPPFSAAEHGLLTEFETATAALYEIRSLATAYLRRNGGEWE